MKKFTYKNTLSKDLFAILDAEAKNAGVLEDGVSLQDFMDPWLTRFAHTKANVFRSHQSKSKTRFAHTKANVFRSHQSKSKARVGHIKANIFRSHQSKSNPSGPATQ